MHSRAGSIVLLSWIRAYSEVVVFIRVVGSSDMLGRDGEAREVRRRWGRAGHDDAIDEKIVKTLIVTRTRGEREDAGRVGRKRRKAALCC